MTWFDSIKLKVLLASVVFADFACALIVEIVPLAALRDPVLIQRWLDDRKGLPRLFRNGLSFVRTDAETLVGTPAGSARGGSNVSMPEWFRQLQATR